jgi:hypothetical protein
LLLLSYVLHLLCCYYYSYIYYHYYYYITLSGPIDDKIARTLVMQMMYLEAEDPTQVNLEKTHSIEREHILWILRYKFSKVRV